MGEGEQRRGVPHVRQLLLPVRAVLLPEVLRGEGGGRGEEEEEGLMTAWKLFVRSLPPERPVRSGVVDDGGPLPRYSVRAICLGVKITKQLQKNTKCWHLPV